MKQYNGVPLDGKAMRIEIAGSERDLTEAPLRRVGGVDSGRIGRREDRRSPGGPRRSGGGAGRRGGNGGGGGGRLAVGRGGRGGGGGGGREKKVEVSKDKLDEEMEEYMKSKN